MKEIWVITERSDIYRGGEWSFENYDSGCRAFSNFEAAKKAFRNRIKEIVETEEGVFTNGRITAFSDAVEEMSWLEEECNEFILKRLPEFFTNPDYEISEADLPEVIDEGSVGYAIDIENGHLLVRAGDPSTVWNGDNPYIFVNCFSMENTDKDYSWHIEDTIDDYNYHLFLDLRKVEIED